MHAILISLFRRVMLLVIVVILYSSIGQAALADEMIKGVTLAPEEYVEIKTENSGWNSFEISAALAGNRNSNGIGKAGWHMDWCDAAGSVLQSVGLRWGNECLGDPLDRRFLRLSVDSVAPDGSRHELFYHDFYDGVDLYGGFNTLSVEKTAGGIVSFWVGKDQEYYAGECSAPPKDARGVRIQGNRKLKIRYAAYRHIPDPAVKLLTDWTEDEVREYLAGKGVSAVEGIWKFLDRDNDALYAQPGGSYMLAVVKSRNNDDGVAAGGRILPVYDILYLGGAKVNALSWRPCMLKGRLYPTIFENHYDLEWYDAYMEPMGDEVSADISDGVIFSFDFPLFRSRIRFSRVPLK